MHTTRLLQAVAAFMFALSATRNSWAASDDEDDWKAARKASCAELIDAYKSTVDAERKLAAALKESTDGTVAANVFGVASLAAVGFGFFTWDDNASAEENLADLRNDLRIIRTVSAEKKCELPAGSN